FNFESAVESIQATVVPAEAHPGQTVTYKLDVKLNDGWYTYPTRQPDQRERGSQNKIELPSPGDLIFVEPVTDPDHMKTKPGGSEGTLGYYPGGVTWEFKAVVSPEATAGEKKVALRQFRIVVCYADLSGKGKCLAPKTVPVSAVFRVAGSPVPV